MQLCPILCGRHGPSFSHAHPLCSQPSTEPPFPQSRRSPQSHPPEPLLLTVSTSSQLSLYEELLPPELCLLLCTLTNRIYHTFLFLGLSDQFGHFLRWWHRIYLSTFLWCTAGHTVLGLPRLICVDWTQEGAKNDLSAFWRWSKILRAPGRPPGGCVSPLADHMKRTRPAKGHVMNRSTGSRTKPHSQGACWPRRTQAWSLWEGWVVVVVAPAMFRFGLSPNLEVLEPKCLSWGVPGLLPGRGWFSNMQLTCSRQLPSARAPAPYFSKKSGERLTWQTGVSEGTGRIHITFSRKESMGCIFI